MRIGLRYAMMMLCVCLVTAVGLFAVFEFLIIPWQVDKMVKEANTIAFSIQKVAGLININQQQKLVVEMQQHTKGLSYVLIEDKNGKALVHSNPARIGMVFNDPGTLKTAREGIPFTQIYVRDVNKPSSPYHGERILDILLPYYDLHGKHIGAINVGLSLKSMDESKNKYYEALFGLLILFILIVAYFTYRHYLTIIRPVEEIADAAKQMKEKHISSKLIPKRNDEIGMLAEEFNNMSQEILTLLESLRSREKELQDYVDQLPHLNAKLTKDGDVQILNASGCAMSLMPCDKVIGGKFYNIPWCSGSSETVEEIKTAVETAASGKISVIPEFRCGTEENPMILDFVFKPVVNKNGEVLYIVVEGHNIVDVILAREELQRRREQELLIKAEAETAKKDFYKSTICAITDGKLNLVSYNDIEKELTSTWVSKELTEYKDLTDVRNAIKIACQKIQMSEDKIANFIVACGEAATNAIKHGNGGIAKIATNDCMVQVCIQDNGHGIDTMFLPNATLRSRYSSMVSLGMGYSLILASVDKIYLATDKEGTWILMEKLIKDPVSINSLDELPDTW